MYIDQGYIVPRFNDTSVASLNVAAIQAALSAGGLVQLKGAGVVYINAPLVIPDFTGLVLDPSLIIKQAPGANGNLLQSAAYNRAWQSVTSISWTSGLSATVYLPNHNRSAGEWFWLRGTSGTTDPAFTGIFPILSITDPDHFVVSLYRIPQASPTGTITGKKADQNVFISGGVWDYDVANNGGSVGSASHIAVLAGIQNLRVRDVTGTNAAKYFFSTGGLRDYDFDGIKGVTGSSGRSASDLVKIYGPSLNGRVNKVIGSPGVDDAVSLQPQEPAAYAQYDFTGGGDVLDVRVSNLDCDYTGTSGVLTYSHPNWVMDGIEIDGVAANAPSSPAVRIDVGAGLTGGILKNIKIKNFRYTNSDSAQPGIIITGNQAIDRVEIDGFYAPNIAGASVPNAIRIDASGSTIKQLSVNGANLNSFANFYFIGMAAGTVNQIEVANSRGKNNSGQLGYVVKLGAGTVDQVVVRDSAFENFLALASVDATFAAVPVIELDRNRLINPYSLANLNASANVSLGGNVISGSNVPAGGLVRINGTNAVIGTIRSRGDNIGVTAGFWLTKVTGNETVNLYAEDFRVDASTIARADAEKFYNTNAALGTLGSAGIVDGLGTSTNSRRLRGDPTKQY